MHVQGSWLKTRQWSHFSHHQPQLRIFLCLFIQHIIKNKSIGIYVLVKPSHLHFTQLKMISKQKKKTALVWNEMNQKHLSIHSMLIDQCTFVRMFFFIIINLKTATDFAKPHLPFTWNLETHIPPLSRYKCSVCKNKWKTEGIKKRNSVK